MSNENIREELEQMTEEQRLERLRKHPLLDVVNNVKDIREIGEASKEIIRSLHPGIAENLDWELIVRTSLEFLKASLTYLTKIRSVDYDLVFVDLGDIMQIGIEFKRFAAEKEGTFNVAIKPKKGFIYDTQEVRLLGDVVQSDPEGLALKYLHGDYTLNIKQLRDICNIAINPLIKDYSIDISANHWELIVLSFHGFMTAAKTYLIANKDKSETGLEIDLANVVNIGIERFEEDEEGACDYELYITPGQIMKLDGKDDGATEI